MPSRPPDRSISGPGDRRARQRLLYSAEQLLGRQPIYTRRTSDKVRLTIHLGVIGSVIALTVWWVVPLHSWAGPVLVTLTRTHGIHEGDLPTLVFLAVALRSIVAMVTRRRRAAAARPSDSRSVRA
jgi:hypothetical protein